MMRRRWKLTTGALALGIGVALLSGGGVAAAGSGGAGAADGEVVRTEQGLVRGIVGEQVRTFRGVPYAAPPVRWQSPRPAAGWSGVRDATQYADSCAQGEHPVGVASTSEDCLYVDVTTPKQAGQQRPVLVWIHGGSFTSGANSVYDPARLAAKGDLVVVQVQYRLGAFGFLASPLLGDGSGNYGLEDQQAALRWVRQNAAAFGGDPRNVTIMGESAGAYSVCDQLASPTAAGLFQRAIIQSGPCAQVYSKTNYAAPRPRAVAAQYGEELAAKLKCTTAACLRGITAEQLLAATVEVHFGPVLGGPVLPRHPAEALRTGRVNRVPVLHGVNHDEEHGRYGAQEVATGTKLTPADYEAAIKEAFGDDAWAPISAQYPIGERPVGLVMSTALTDGLWAYPAAKTNRLLAARMPTYAFELAGKAPWYAGLDAPAWPYGSHHLSDLAYFFGIGVLQPLDEAQARFADELITRWSAFARTGDPNLPGTTTWPRTAPLDRTVQSLNPAGVTRTDFHRDHQVSFWRSLEN